MKSFSKYLFFLVLISVLSASLSFAQTHKVLVINSYHQGYEWTDVQCSAIIKTLVSKTNSTYIDIKYLDMKNVKDKIQYSDLMRKLFQLNYAEKKPSVIICTDKEALDIIFTNNFECFKNVPVIFSGYYFNRPEMLNSTPSLLGIYLNNLIADNIDLAFYLFPKAKSIAFIHDDTEEGRMLGKEAEKVIEKYSKYSFFFLNKLSFLKLSNAVNNLPEKTVIILLSMNYDIYGEYYNDQRICELVSMNKKIPALGIKSTFLGKGILGGCFADAAKMGEKSAILANDIINGKDIRGLNTNNNFMEFIGLDYKYFNNFSLNKDSLKMDAKYINLEKEDFQKNNHSIIIFTLSGLTLVAIVIIIFILRKKNK